MSSHGCLTDNQVLDGVRVLVRQNKIRWTDHSEQRMEERGYDRGQIRQCLLSGVFVQRPVIPNRTGPLQYEVKMRAKVDGVWIEVVASLVPVTKVVVITVIDPENRS
jgi:hypothetical protein